MKALIASIVVLMATQAYAFNKAEILTEEYNRIKSWVQQSQTDGVIGNLYPYIQMDGYILMFSNDFDNQHETIRFFINGEGHEKDFSITYYKSQYMVENKMVIRRFVGPEPTGWRNDTIDFDTQEYLGFQGTDKPRLNDKAQEIIKEWNLTLF